MTAAVPALPGVLSSDEVAATAQSIAAVQLGDGMIPWFPGGHADPWNHVEAAMALAVAGLRRPAEAAYRWLAGRQHDDGSWCSYYLADRVEDARRDTNVVSYVATGVWFHYLCTADGGFLEWAWPMVKAAVDFALRHQTGTGELLWCTEADGSPGRFALLTGSSSAYLSLRCAIAAAEELDDDQPEWELAAGRLARAVAERPEVFEPKERWAMDWYYPVLVGALTGEAAAARIDERWGDFVMPGLGVRCVSDRPWVTAAETAECAMALASIGRRDDAEALLRWSRGLRHHDGSYWTGWTHPDRTHFPGGERSTYTAAALVLAVNTLAGEGPSAGLFLGEGLPTGVLDAVDYERG
ncbi:MAG TPA: hypothetical protein VE990_01465 [Acidimicrobiales bacterium]|nr:hypothetical protein [Acidimicrobiales bacterium]